MGKPYFYLYASSDEATIEEFASSIAIPGAETKQTRMSLPNGTYKWSWSSPRTECETSFPEDELLLYLRKSKDSLKQTRPLRSSLDELTAIIVWPDKNSRGITVKKELMEMLLEADMTLDMDNS